jgi:hypothetical protein
MTVVESVFKDEGDCHGDIVGGVAEFEVSRKGWVFEPELRPFAEHCT